MIEWLFSIACHQNPERSLKILNYLLPICARCSGLYIGFLITVGIIFTTHLKQKIRILSIKKIIELSVIFLIFASEGYFENILQLSNIVRFLVGSICGISSAILLLRVSELIGLWLNKFQNHSTYKFIVLLTILLLTFFYLPYSIYYLLFAGILLLHISIGITLGSITCQFISNKSIRLICIYSFSLILIVIEIVIKKLWY